MKHGHKEKGKKAKAKPSGKKSSPPASKSKASQSAQIKKSGVAAAATPSKGGADGKNRGRGTPDGPSFNNPIVATAFKRAVKKFPNAFRRLTD
jgi:hypothetical protein